MASCSYPSELPSLVAGHLLSDGPRRAFHAGCVINNNLYIHGGIDKKGSTTPLDSLFCLDLLTGEWSTLSTQNSPTLSHHCALNLHDRYMLIIGGWDGTARTSELFLYDTTEDRWSHLEARDFPAGAGLNCHSAVLLANGDILTIGREGGLRPQLNTSNAFLLKGNIRLGFTYTSYPLGVSSRSGHTANILGSDLIIYGGREDRVLEIHSGHEAAPSPSNSSQFVARLIAKDNLPPPMPKPPCGRKHHVSAAASGYLGGGGLVIHGGESNDGLWGDPVGEMFLLIFKPVMTWYKIGGTELGLAGHVCAVHGDSLVLHGGEGAKGPVSTKTFRLNVL